jgi:flagellar biosynthesis chaperone FliJ
MVLNIHETFNKATNYQHSISYLSRRIGETMRGIKDSKKRIEQWEKEWKEIEKNVKMGMIPSRREFCVDLHQIENEKNALKNMEEKLEEIEKELKKTEDKYEELKALIKEGLFSRHEEIPNCYRSSYCY